jgi:hypothetical protein
MRQATKEEAMSKTRDEIAKKICEKFCIIPVDNNCGSFYCCDNAMKQYKQIADWHIAEIEKAEKAARLEVAEKMLNICCDGQDFADICKAIIIDNTLGEK